MTSRGWLGAGLLCSQCAVCRSWPARAVCHACLERFAEPQPRCRTCALVLPADLSLGLSPQPDRCPGCTVRPPELDACFAALTYAYPWSDLIGRFKFSNQTGWSPFFADMMLSASLCRNLLAQLDAADFVVPMPLAQGRLQSRGFNQAWELAKALHQQSDCKARLDATLLLRLRATLAQSRLKRAQRLHNVKSAFAVDPLRHAALKGRRVLLVDDVMTSGASVFTAAQALREAGASEVAAALLARTEPA